MYILYGSPGTASMAVHQTLLEIGAAHQVHWLDLDAKAQKQPDYLRLNPSGTVPTLIVDGTPVSECAALLMLLAERHPQAAPAPAVGTPQRATYLQWMLHLANTLQPAFRQWFYPQDYAPPAQQAESKASARARIEAVWQRLDDHLATQGPHVAGEAWGVVDLYATMLMRWSRNMPRPATQWPHLAALAECIKARASWKRLYEIEGLSEWA